MKQNEYKPLIRKSLIPKCSESTEIPDGFDATEYEFLQSNKSEVCKEENGDVLQLSKESLDFSNLQRSLTSSLVSFTILLFYYKKY